MVNLNSLALKPAEPQDVDDKICQKNGTAPNTQQQEVKVDSVPQGTFTKPKCIITLTANIGKGRYGLVFKAKISKEPAKQAKKRLFQKCLNADVETTEQGDDREGKLVALKILRVLSTSTNVKESVSESSKKREINMTIENKKQLPTRSELKIEQRERGVNEVECLIRFSYCPYVVNLLGFEERRKGSFLRNCFVSWLHQPFLSEIWVLTELHDNHNANILTLNARSQKTIDMKKIKIVIASLLLALKEIHKAGFVHRDVKPVNLLLDCTSSGLKRAILCDFGACSTLNDIPLWKGTFQYLSPEYLFYCQNTFPFASYANYEPAALFKKLAQLEKNEESLKAEAVCKASAGVDIWSVGITLLGFVIGWIPFFAFSQQQYAESLSSLYKCPEKKLIAVDQATNSYHFSEYVLQLYNSLFASSEFQMIKEFRSKEKPKDYFKNLIKERIGVDVSLLSFLSRCLVISSEKRGTVEELLKHEFIKHDVESLIAVRY